MKFDKNNPWLTAIIGGTIGAILAGLLVGSIFYHREQKQVKTLRERRVNFADKFLKKELPKEALEIYNDVLQKLPAKDKDFYAYIQNQTARCYLNLAKRGNERRRNLIRATVAFEEGLRSYGGQRSKESFLAETDLSATYWSLSWFQDAQANIAKSVELFEDLKKRYPMEIYYHRIVCVGISPGDDFFKPDPQFPVLEMDIKKAIQHGEETLKVCTLEKYPVAYAMIKGSLGFYHSDFANFGDKIENLNKSIEAFRESLKVFIADEYPMNYADLNANIAIAYLRLSDVHDKSENLQQAIEILDIALGIAKLETCPDEYALIQEVLAMAYQKLSSIKDEENNLIKAITCIKSALRVYKSDENLFEYARAKHQLGNFYSQLSHIKEKDINIIKSVDCFENSLDLLESYKHDKTESKYTSVQELLGYLYLNLSSIKERDINTMKAASSFEKALNVLNAEKDPIGYKRLRLMLEYAKKEVEKHEGEKAGK